MLRGCVTGRGNQPSALHPTIGVHTPLVFDIVDTWNDRSIGGCTYHATHPGGLSPTTFPVNAYEAESRRLGRFLPPGPHARKTQTSNPRSQSRFSFYAGFAKDLSFWPGGRRRAGVLARGNPELTNFVCSKPISKLAGFRGKISAPLQYCFMLLDMALCCHFMNDRGDAMS